MKHLSAVRQEAERIAKRYDLEVKEVSGFSDGVYRVEFAEKKEERQIGFISEQTGKAGKHTPRGRK